MAEKERLDGTVYVYSNSSKAFCRLKHRHRGMELDDRNNIIMCMDEKGGDIETQRKRLEDKLNDNPAETSDNFSFNITPFVGVNQSEVPHSSTNADAVKISHGTIHGHMVNCRRHHFTENLRFHFQGEVMCGEHVDADHFTLRRMSHNDYEIGMFGHKRICGVDRHHEFTCRKKCILPFGCPHLSEHDQDTARLTIFTAKVDGENVSLVPWEGLEHHN